MITGSAAQAGWSCGGRAWCPAASGGRASHPLPGHDEPGPAGAKATCRGSPLEPRWRRPKRGCSADKIRAGRRGDGPPYPPSLPTRRSGVPALFGGNTSPEGHEPPPRGGPRPSCQGGQHWREPLAPFGPREREGLRVETCDDAGRAAPRSASSGPHPASSRRMALRPADVDHTGWFRRVAARPQDALAARVVAPKARPQRPPMTADLSMERMSCE